MIKPTIFYTLKESIIRGDKKKGSVRRCNIISNHVFRYWCVHIWASVKNSALSGSEEHLSHFIVSFKLLVHDGKFRKQVRDKWAAKYEAFNIFFNTCIRALLLSYQGKWNNTRHLVSSFKGETSWGLNNLTVPRGEMKLSLFREQ